MRDSLEDATLQFRGLPEAYDFFIVTSEEIIVVISGAPTSELHPKASICSPARLIPAIEVMSGAHYRTSIQELLHPELAFT